MRVLLRRQGTDRYFEDDEKWTSDRLSARDFGTSGRAILFAMESQLSGMEVVLAFDNPQDDLAIPLQSGSPSPRPCRPSGDQ